MGKGGRQNENGEGIRATHHDSPALGKHENESSESKYSQEDEKSTDGRDNEESYASTKNAKSPLMHIPTENLSKVTNLFECVIIRNRSGVNLLYPQYNLHFRDQTN